MTWFDRIEDLQYYHQPKDVPCYCEAITYPQDMYLQGQMPAGNNNYTINIYVYSANGLTQYEDATTYFDTYFFKVPGIATHYFNARLRSFSPAMCAHECYILRVVVTQNDGVTMFNKYTERYCQNNCCDVARNISFEQVGFAPFVISNDPAFVSEAIDTVVAGSNSSLFIPSGSCGEQLIRIISKFDCIDNFTGDFYGTPDVIISGTPDFEYRKVTTMKGRIVRRPREITREISYNCKVQRVESTPQYLLEGFEFLPPWKMYEIEGQLHANRIYVDDFAGVREYRYSGGTPMKKIGNCYELFKLEAVMEDCTQRQVFGCKPDCTANGNFDGSNLIYAIPALYSGGAFYNSNKEMVAADYAGLMDYLRTRNGVAAVNDVAMDDMDCAAYKVVSVTTDGDVERHIYYDAPLANNKVFGRVVSDINELCSYLPKVCAVPVAGEFAVSVFVCAMPTSGTFTIEDIDTDTVAINGYGDWVKDAGETWGAVYHNEVTFSLHVTNDTITEDPDFPDDDVFIGAVQIGVVGSQGRPTGTVILNSSNNPLPEDVVVTIDDSGRVVYYGPATDATSTEVIIELNNLTYNI